MIIGLSGYARSGKNTVADILGDGYRQVSLAEPMREILLKLNPALPGSHTYNGNTVPSAAIRLQDYIRTYGWEGAKAYHPEVRRLLQVLGTEIGREMFGQDFWVFIAMKDVRVGDNVVFTDVRFPNEAQAIVDHGGEVWRINRPGVVAVNDHSSEHSMDDWKFHRIIENDSDMDDLNRKVHGI